MNEHFSGSECRLSHLEFVELIWMKLTGTKKSGPNETGVFFVADCHNRMLFGNLLSQSLHLVTSAPSWISDGSYIDTSGGILLRTWVKVSSTMSAFMFSIGRKETNTGRSSPSL